MNINELYEMARTGDRAAEEKLFHTLSVRFRALAVQKVRDKDDCDDIVQNAVLTISQEYKVIEFRTSFSAWAYKVLQNRILKHFNIGQRKIHHQENLSRFFERPADFEPDPTLESRLVNCLQKISKVDTRYARVLNFFYQGYSTDDVCEKLAITANNSYVILSRARSMLKLCLEVGEIE